jgi:hypothetical protein
MQEKRRNTQHKNKQKQHHTRQMSSSRVWSYIHTRDKCSGPHLFSGVPPFFVVVAVPTTAFLSNACMSSLPSCGALLAVGFSNSHQTRPSILCLLFPSYSLPTNTALLMSTQVRVCVCVFAGHVRRSSGGLSASPFDLLSKGLTGATGVEEQPPVLESRTPPVQAYKHTTD